MSNSRKFLPLQSAIAAWTVVRVTGGLDCTWRSGLMHTTIPFPIYRGLTR